jgi:enoyl-CoA hydratase/carnithine racemase
VRGKQPGKVMHSLFNYKKLLVRLDKTTKSLIITLNSKDDSNAISTELLFELESVLSWCTNKIEINSILIDSSTTHLSLGPNLDKISQYSIDQLTKFLKKIQTINHALFHLPQTVIIDLGMGCEDVASELIIGADFRVASVNTKVSFAQTRLGRVPSSGGMGFLSAIINPAVARNWIMSNKEIEAPELLSSGFLYAAYDETNKNEIINDLLFAINQQAPIQRIQAKLGFYESIKARLEHAIHFEGQIGKASLISEDWKSIHKADDTFMQAKSMGKSVKLTLVKNEDEKLPENVTPIV